MKGILSFLCALLLAGAVCCGSAQAGEEVVVVYGDDAYPPYSYRIDGRMRGIYADILLEAGNRMEGFLIEIRLLPWKKLLEAAANGEVFAVFPPYYRPEERPYLDEYSVPILEEETAVFCNKDVLKASRPRWPEDYFGLRIGQNLSFETGGDRFNQAVADGDITVEALHGTEDNVRKLLAGEVDCYINDRNAVYWTIKQQNQGDYPYRYGILQGAVIHREQGYLAYSHDFGASYRARFMTEFDRAIASMRADGLIEKIVRSYIH
ncbi:substrate-binding periplasmic protein [Salidesulfovibrio onnuriiensis]|uniref:substrate-binding periplasmic protein n=1 Tax=Salidesulfovibrio onnuriiensis TaxID=2583823 RepID=UPI0011C93D43|nr:ABC transporter substrate-binding protein [Salidesulfovibrio onnuriiensis]